MLSVSDAGEDCAIESDAPAEESSYESALPCLRDGRQGNELLSCAGVDKGNHHGAGAEGAGQLGMRISRADILAYVRSLRPPAVRSQSEPHVVVDALVSDDGSRIKCLKCGMVSYHPGDVEHRYCGYCHEFHKHPMIERF